MKNLLKTLGMVMVFASFAGAANYAIPQSLNGKEPHDANILGVDILDATGTTNNYGVTSPCYLHWVAISSVVAGAYVSFRDSATLNSTSHVGLMVMNTAGSVTQVITFNPPVIFRNGMSITLNGNITTAGRWTFGYRSRLDADIGVDPTKGTSASD